jgi:hypothetical protein
MSEEALQRERERQQALLQSLWRLCADPGLQPWLRAAEAPRTARGLVAYRSNAGANAERALAIDFPTVQALIGDEAFAGLSRACWRAHPPLHGDMAQFGAELPGFIETDERLAELPYLADVARLDRLVALAGSAADAAPAEGFELLGQEEPDHLAFVAAPGFAVLRSRYPVVSIWRAHREGEDAEAHFAAARMAMDQQQGENALVWRRDWQVQIEPVDEREARWCDAVHAEHSLGLALQLAAEGFEFEPWLLRALRQRQVLGVKRL